MKDSLNNEIYKSPFSKGYWRSTLTSLGTLRIFTMVALLTAFAILSETYFIPLSREIKISYTFIPIALCSVIGGPYLTVLCCIIEDMLGVILSGQTVFAGYILSTVLTGLIYSFFFYRSHFSFKRIVFAKLIDNLFVNVLLGAVWRKHYFDYPIPIAIGTSGIKNLIMLPLEVFILSLIFSSLYMPLKRTKLIPQRTESSINRQKLLETVLVLILCIAVSVVLILLYGHYKAPIDNFIKQILA